MGIIKRLASLSGATFECLMSMCVFPPNFPMKCKTWNILKPTLTSWKITYTTRGLHCCGHRFVWKLKLQPNRRWFSVNVTCYPKGYNNTPKCQNVGKACPAARRQGVGVVHAQLPFGNCRAHLAQRRLSTKDLGAPETWWHWNETEWSTTLLRQ